MFSGAREYRNQGELMQVRLTIIGTMSLLMHNAQLSDPLATITKQLKKVSGKRIKTEADHEEMARIEFEGGLYFDDESGPYIPSANIHACLLKAARMTRQGPAVERGVQYLIDTQRADGCWDEDLFTGTGFPGDFYINYEMYRLLFPISALGRYLARQR